MLPARFWAAALPGTEAEGIPVKEAAEATPAWLLAEFTLERAERGSAVISSRLTGTHGEAAGDVVPAPVAAVAELTLGSVNAAAAKASAAFDAGRDACGGALSAPGVPIDSAGRAAAAAAAAAAKKARVRGR